MEIAVSELATGMADVRRVPLSRLAQEASGAEGTRRVLPGPVGETASLASFNSSI